MRTLFAHVLALLLVAAVTSPGAGQTVPEDIGARLQRLETETQVLRAELERLREYPVRMPALEATPAALSPAETAPAGGGDGDYFTLPELQAEMKKLAWTKGDFKIVPYGWLWGNMVYATERTVPGSYTLWAQSQQVQGEDEFIVDGRNTRLGVDIAGPRIACLNCAQSGGKVEIDFQGGFAGTAAGIANQENKGTVLLRHAYLEVKDEEFRILMGQTWDVISPLFPGMLMYSVGWDAGNMGYRRGQLRGERYLAFSDVNLATVQLSLNQNVFTDSLAVFQGEPAAWPVIEGRVAWTFGDRGKNGLPVTLGCSGHVGEQMFDIPATPGDEDITRRTWSLGADLRIPITRRLGFQGEFFTGENLGTFLGGIGQGISIVAPFDAVRSTGGWCEVWYDWIPQFHSHAGFSIDDPVDQDVPPGGRTYNHFYFLNFIYDYTKQFTTGLEISVWETLYNGLRPGDATRLEFVMKYGF